MARKPSSRRPPAGAARNAAVGRLRIIGGQWRGRLLPVVDRPGLRPTPDRVRETLFNWLAHDLHDVRVLDMFAGTGALGFEALSRGAASVVMFEPDSLAARQLQDSAETLGVGASQLEIRRGDAVAQLAASGDKFDVVFIDPPFQANLWDQALAVLPPLLNPAHQVYVESSRDWPGPADSGWREIKHKRAADVEFRLLDYSGHPESMRGDNS